MILAIHDPHNVFDRMIKLFKKVLRHCENMANIWCAGQDQGLCREPYIIMAFQIQVISKWYSNAYLDKILQSLKCLIVYVSVHRYRGRAESLIIPEGGRWSRLLCHAAFSSCLHDDLTAVWTLFKDVFHDTLYIILVLWCGLRSVFANNGTQHLVLAVAWNWYLCSTFNFQGGFLQRFTWFSGHSNNASLFPHYLARWAISC